MASSLDSRPAAIARFIVRRANRSQIVDRRRKNHQLLAEGLAGVDGLSVLAPTLPDNAVPYVFPIWVEQPERSYHALRLAGVPVFRWDILWPGVPADAGRCRAELVCTMYFSLGATRTCAKRISGRLP